MFSWSHGQEYKYTPTQWFICAPRSESGGKYYQCSIACNTRTDYYPALFVYIDTKSSIFHTTNNEKVSYFTLSNHLLCGTLRLFLKKFHLTILVITIYVHTFFIPTNLNPIGIWRSSIGLDYILSYSKENEDIRVFESLSENNFNWT